MLIDSDFIFLSIFHAFYYAPADVYESYSFKPMTVFLRQTQNINEYILDKLYAILKTYELEAQKDEEMEKGFKKEKTVVLILRKVKNRRMH